MRVPCKIEKLDEGFLGPRTKATCSTCGHVVEVRGDSDRSVRFAMVKMRDECPMDDAELRAENFYVAEGGEDARTGEGEYENLISSGRAPRGREVELMVKDKPLKPPRRPRHDE